MLKGNYSVGEVDFVMGFLIGRLKSVMFWMLDVVGLDIFIYVVNNVFDKVEGKEKEVFDVFLFMK